MKDTKDKPNYTKNCDIQTAIFTRWHRRRVRPSSRRSGDCSDRGAVGGAAPRAYLSTVGHAAPDCRTSPLADRACQDVVGRRLSERIAQGQSAVSALNTGSYCDARQRLPTALPVTLGNMIGERLEAMTPSAWRWQRRCVKLFDGTTITMPDTPSNQNAYPQSSEQKLGLGFPIAGIGALIGLASGAILGYQVAACKGKGTGEQSLLANTLGRIQQRWSVAGRCAVGDLVDHSGSA